MGYNMRSSQIKSKKSSFIPCFIRDSYDDDNDTSTSKVVKNLKTPSIRPRSGKSVAKMGNNNKATSISIKKRDRSHNKVGYTNDNDNDYPTVYFEEMDTTIVTGNKGNIGDNNNPNKAQNIHQKKKWTREEELIVLRERKEHGPILYLKKAMERLPDRSESAISQRMIRLELQKQEFVEDIDDNLYFNNNEEATFLEITHNDQDETNENNEMKKKKWIPREDQIVLNMRRKHGKEYAPRCFKLLPGRTMKHIYQRWHFLKKHPSCCLDPPKWSKEEDDIIICEKSKNSNLFAIEASKLLSNRTAYQVALRWLNYLDRNGRMRQDEEDEEDDEEEKEETKKKRRRRRKIG